jgi:hypothetical protein
LPGQKPPDGLPPLLTPEPLPVPPLPLPLEPPGDVPPLEPLEPPAVEVVVELVVVVVLVVGCVVDVDVVDDRVVVGWGFGIVRVVVEVVSARGTCVVVVGSELPQPAAAVAATAVATRAMANLRLRGACALRSVRAALRLMRSRRWRAGEGRSRGSR